MKKKSDRYIVVHSSVRELINVIDAVFKLPIDELTSNFLQEVLSDLKLDLVNISELLRKKNTKYRNSNGKSRASRH